MDAAEIANESRQCGRSHRFTTQANPYKKPGSAPMSSAGGETRKARFQIADQVFRIFQSDVVTHQRTAG